MLPRILIKAVDSEIHRGGIRLTAMRIVGEQRVVEANFVMTPGGARRDHKRARPNVCRACPHNVLRPTAGVTGGLRVNSVSQVRPHMPMKSACSSTRRSGSSG